MMFKQSIRLALLTLIAAVAFTGAAYAHCGTCGVGDKHDEKDKTATSCPAKDAKDCPTDAKDCPVDPKDCPKNTSECPEGKAACPADKSACPEAKDCPDAKDCPADKSACPEAKACCPAGAGMKAQVGSEAVDFTLNDQEGNAHSLSDFKGKTVVLTWVNPGCPFIVRHFEAKTLTNLEKQFADKDVVFLAIDSTNSVTPESTKASMDKFGYEIPTLLDAEGMVGRAYDARTTPQVAIIDAEGKLVYNGAIDNDPRGNKPEEDRVNHVEVTLNQLLAGEAVTVGSTKPYGCSVKYGKAKTAASQPSAKACPSCDCTKCEAA